MVLVDSSVWVRYLAGEEPYLTHARDLFTQDAVLGHELVYGELLIGDRGTRSGLLADLHTVKSAPTVSHDEVVQFVRTRRLMARGIGWIDVHLLAATLVTHARLWTADTALATM